MAASRSKFRDELLAAIALPSGGHGDVPEILARLRGAHPLQDAAVLVGIIPYERGPSVILTRRTDHLADHAGQVSLPGGSIEPGDGDAVAAALRETREELGIEPSSIEVLGTLPEYHTISHYRVTPVLGLVDPAPVYAPDPHEVAEVFEMPLAHVRDPRRRERRHREFMGAEVAYWSFDWEGRTVWGATAAMLVELCERLDRITGSGQ